jgi:hypothetical protein
MAGKSLFGLSAVEIVPQHEKVCLELVRAHGATPGEHVVVLD